jgi:hypothetical protein
LSGWDRLGLVLTALAFVFLSANTWLEPGRRQKKLMDVCDAVYQSRGDMLKDQNWDLERLAESRDLSSKAYSLCLDRTVDASQSKYEDRSNPLTYVYPLFIALIFVLLPYWIMVRTIRWAARGFS